MSQKILSLSILLILQITLAQTTIIKNGLIIDGTGKPALTEHLIVINNNTIIGVYPEANYKTPKDASIIDAKNLSILPGFINAHTHFTKDFEERKDNHLAYGVTALCNLGAGINQMPDFDVLIKNNQYAARGFKAGPFIAKKTGYAEANWGAGANYNINGTSEAKNAVNDLIARGADYIKISFEPGPGTWPILSLEEASAVVEAAHEHNVNVIAHVEDASYLQQALDSGVDAITHVGHRWQGSQAITPDGLHEGYDKLISRMAEEIIFIPTLDVLSGNRPSDSLKVTGMRNIVSQFWQQGGILAVGNDYPLGVTKPGIPLGEMKHLLNAGLTELDVIVAGTKNSALACGQGDKLGTLEANKFADLIIIEGNPLNDITTLENIRLVMINGVIAFDYR